MIRRKVASSAFWLVVGRSGANLGNFVIFAVLARLLTPQDFGIVALASVFIEIAKILAQGGITQALVQRPTWVPELASTAFWLNLLIAAILAAFMILVVAPLATSFYPADVKPVLSVLALTFVIDAARGAHEAKLQHELDFKPVALRNIFAAIVGGSVGITLAFKGFGVWALVANQMANSAADTVFLWAKVRWRPRFRFSTSDAGSLLGFGMKVSGASALGALNLRVADIAIGFYLGATALGLYRVGGRAINMLNSLAIAPLSRVAFSAFSRANETGSVAQAYMRVSKVCAAIAIPTFFGLAVLSHDVVVTLFGAKWEESAAIMAALSFLGATRTVTYFSQAAMASAGAASAGLISAGVAVASNLLITLATVRYGVLAVAIGVAARAYITLPFVLMMLKRTIKVSPWAVVAGFTPPLIASLLMQAAVWSVQHWVLVGWAPAWRLPVCILLGATVYGAIMLLFWRNYVIELKAELMPILAGSAGRASARLSRARRRGRRPVVS